jgi:hypothetical protein
MVEAVHLLFPTSWGERGVECFGGCGCRQQVISLRTLRDCRIDTREKSFKIRDFIRTLRFSPRYLRELRTDVARYTASQGVTMKRRSQAPD